MCAGALPGHPPPRRLQVQLEPEDTQVDHTALLTLQGDPRGLKLLPVGLCQGNHLNINLKKKATLKKIPKHPK